MECEEENKGIRDRLTFVSNHQRREENRKNTEIEAANRKEKSPKEYRL